MLKVMEDEEISNMAVQGKTFAFAFFSLFIFVNTQAAEETLFPNFELQNQKQKHKNNGSDNDTGFSMEGYHGVSNALRRRKVSVFFYISAFAMRSTRSYYLPDPSSPCAKVSDV